MLLISSMDYILIFSKAFIIKFTFKMKLIYKNVLFH